FHFHVYWHTSDPAARAAALAFHTEILRLNDVGFFVAVIFRINERPVGPHPMGSYEVWSPKEYFARTFQWMAVNRPDEVSILLHPLSRQERLGESLHSASVLPEFTEDVPLQYPELGLGYSATPASSATAALKNVSISPAASNEISKEVKEFHFHIYWHTSDTSARAAALNFRNEVLRLNREGFFVAVPLERVNEAPLGPHPMGSYEVWCPTEYFARTYQWMIANRPPLVSILVHLLSKEEVIDHTTRAIFLGPSAPLFIGALRPVLDEYPAQYPELRL
ncbi:hypothetical protein HK405_013093, partial [Cladochytrium tenue]